MTKDEEIQYLRETLEIYKGVCDDRALVIKALSEEIENHAKVDYWHERYTSLWNRYELLRAELERKNK